MKLIGMLDSPYVRRVAISLKLMGVPFEHESVSVFRHYERFQSINPLVKAPTLVCDDGTVLMDSTLILDYVESLAASERRLAVKNTRALHELGVGLVAMEKTVQVYYETEMRPPTARHKPWLDRVTAQMRVACDAMEVLVQQAAPWLHGERIMQPDVTLAVAWRFTRFIVPESIEPTKYPALVAFSARAEALPEFASTPLD